MYHWDDLRHSAFDNSSSLRLAAIAGTESFYYAITDHGAMPCAVKGFHSDRKFHFFDKPLGYLSQMMGDDDLLYADFDHVHIAVRGVPFVALKPDEGDHHNIETRLLEVTDLSQVDEIYSDITDEELHVAFALPQLFAQETHAWFSNATISHVMSSLMMCAIKHSRGMTEPLVLVNVSPGFTELVLCNQGRLLFANHYRTAGPEDVLYYTLAVLQNLRMQVDQVVIKCAGPNALNTVPVLQTYLPHTHFFSFPEIHPRSDYPGVDTVDLICVTKCAS